MILTGLHHLTSICGEAKANVAFFTETLGLRMIKQTVNFDDPGTWHLYYGDHPGTPGTVLTFFPFSGVAPGRPGAGEVISYAFSIPAGSLAFWEKHLSGPGQTLRPHDGRFGEKGLVFEDPDGYPIALVENATPLPTIPWPASPVPAEYQIHGFYGITIGLHAAGRSASLLTDILGAKAAGEEDPWQRFMLGEGPESCRIDLLIDPSLPPARPGAGSVHHVAWRTPDDAAQAQALRELRDHRIPVSDIRDRNYFHSIYFHEPGGVLYEIATDGPGFTIDEPLETLGTALRIPSQYEKYRNQIITRLPPLR